MGNEGHKIALYADDILLFLTSLKQIPKSLNQFLAIFNNFSSISGYKINFNKSEAMPLDTLNIADIEGDFPFKRTISGFIYLGIKVSPDLKDM